MFNCSLGSRCKKAEVGKVFEFCHNWCSHEIPTSVKTEICEIEVKK